jgi:hypothetical protein
MIYFGEVRVYVGGYFEMELVGEMLVPVWKEGRMLCKARYKNKYERRKIIEKCRELYDEVEVGIIPDTTPEEDEE